MQGIIDWGVHGQAGPDAQPMLLDHSGEQVNRMDHGGLGHRLRGDGAD